VTVAVVVGSLRQACLLLTWPYHHHNRHWWSWLWLGTAWVVIAGQLSGSVTVSGARVGHRRRPSLLGSRYRRHCHRWYQGGGCGQGVASNDLEMALSEGGPL